MSAPLRLEGLTVRYPGAPPAIDQLDLTLHEGERAALIGANGAGKSTLLLSLCGLLPITSGRAWIYDTPITPKGIKRARQQVGFVFQDPDDQLFMPTVFEDTLLSARRLGEAGAEARAAEALRRFDLLRLRDRPIHQLSGGEKRLVAIASTLAADPKLLLMDEPSANLDPRGRRRLIEALKRADRAQLIATHDLELALEVCARAFILQGGALVAAGRVAEILSDEAILRRCDLEKPLSLRPCPRCGMTR
ncbi:energy-coupling factor ABC transporter ATP-binding protein [Myxococcota bacterium]|nr:energy-coupling factor ABC transporter ATP-binding protein [Myxococcota bacterium]MBU1429256.1 energy-coupling factor ABC transporter ATP-binding protein [Myxococcota bacterium]MBU1896542.1 energy-coupling factor ABC transporter ATP-binding protein [Myxococcota bacterium]